MKRIFCCLGEGTSTKVVQEQQEPPEPPRSSQPPQPPQALQLAPQPREPPEPSEPSDSTEQMDSSESTDEENDEAPFITKLSLGVVFRWPEIVHGTENFRLAHFLGLGNFGKVYRCDFPRINKVGAAKIQDNDNPFGHSEFVAEIAMLHAANHPNVIKLLGKCFGRRYSALVYEFMPNGSLEHYLFAHVRPGPGLRQERQVLDWDTRMRIAVGVAEALIYLHTELKVIHRDVKVANVLLDDDLTPKLTDFGLATKAVENEDGIERQHPISPIKGTRGYTAPETEELGLVTTKSDVYSYGVFLLVLFTGRKAYDLKRPVATRRITDWVMELWRREECTPMVIDVALGNKFSVEGFNSLFHTAKMCINADALERPDMGFVKTMVGQAAAYPPVPE